MRSRPVNIGAAFLVVLPRKMRKLAWKGCAGNYRAVIKAGTTSYTSEAFSVNRQGRDDKKVRGWEFGGFFGSILKTGKKKKNSSFLVAKSITRSFIIVEPLIRFVCVFFLMQYSDDVLWGYLHMHHASCLCLYYEILKLTEELDLLKTLSLKKKKKRLSPCQEIKAFPTNCATVFALDIQWIFE